MLGYIVRRLLAALLVVVLVSMIVFALFFFGPSNAASVICEQQGRCTEQRLQSLNHALGYDQSVVTAYGDWFKGLFKGREIKMGATYECHAPCLGISFSSRNQVTDELKQKLPATVSLVLGAAVIYLIVGVVVGTLAARWRGSMSDRALVSSTLIVSSIPYYLVALLAWLYLVNTWGLFPETGYTPLRDNPGAWFTGLLLPWLVLGLYNMTQYTRFGRGSMLESLGEDYVRTATAKGVSANRVVFKHALRAAIVPIITIFGLDIAVQLAGAIITETIFDIDGIGAWTLSALPTNFPVISAGVLVAAILVVTANLAVDIIYGFLDPRVRIV